MEAAGLAAGVVGLLALYDEAASTLYSIKHFSSESLRVTSRYNATKVLFERWGREFRAAENIGVYSDLSVQGTATAVADLLRSIRDVFAKADSTMSRYHDQNPFVASETDSVKAHFTSRVKWAVADSKKLSSQVQDFDDLVQKLYSLVPPEGLQNDEFRKLQDALVQRQHTEALDRAIHWLDATTPENSYDAYCSARLDTTCSWIDTHPVYQAWSSEKIVKSSKVLWINGPPGFGKSVLCAYIIRSLLSQNHSPVYYFFCSGDSESQRNPSSILRAWMHQAIHQDEAILDTVLQYLISCLNTKATLSDLWQLLKKLMSHIPNAVFAVDGLDECPRSRNRVDLHRTREDLLNELLKVASGAKARVLVVSRNEGDIRSQLSPHGPQPPCLKIYELPITRDLVSDDVARFATHIVNYKLPAKPNQFNETLAARMAKRGDGMFLFIRLQSQNLRPRKGNSQLERAVDEMPTELPRIYSRNWSSIQNYSASDKQLAEAILRWVTFAQRPLSIAELSEIVAVLGGNNDGSPQFDDLPDPFDSDYVDSEILGLCGSFLELRAAGTDTKWESQTVHLIHYSAEEFLLGDHSDAPFSQHPLQHYQLLKSCLTYLNHEDTWQSDEREDWGIIYQRPFLTYAVRQWYNNLEESKVYLDQLQPQLQSFFAVSNRNWDSWRQLDEAYHDTSSESLGYKTYLSAEGSAQSQNRPGSRMYYAAFFGLEEVVRYLYSTGTTFINEACGYFGNSVQAAAGNGHLGVLRFLLEVGADIHLHGRYGSALHAAAAYNQDKAIVELLQQGASVSATDKDGNACLHLTLQHGDIKTVRLLVQNGASVSSTDKKGRSPLHISAASGRTDITKYLLDSGTDPAASTANGKSSLQYAAEYGYLEVVKLLCSSGADVSSFDRYNSTPLHKAAYSGHYEVVQFLLDFGADVSTHDRYKATPLDLAAFEGHIDVVKLLMESGADLSTIDQNGDTPLTLASYKGHIEVVNMLIEYGADVSAADKGGNTSLHLASWRGHTEVVKALIQAGAAISKLDQEGDTPLITACVNNQAEVARLLIEAGADVNASNDYGRTPVHYAFDKEHPDVVLILLGSQASLNSLDSWGQAPWQLASPEFRTRIPQCKDCKAPTEYDRQQKARLTIQKIAKATSPKVSKDPVSLHSLGNCLQLVQDFPSASVAFDQMIRPALGGESYTYAATCDGCDADIIEKLYSCCICPNFDLCASCMKQYSEGSCFRDCVGHDYLRVPSDDWNPEELCDVYTQEFVDWLKDLALRYQMDSI